jgi:outer membrane protein, heavy metal efflux system
MPRQCASPCVTRAWRRPVLLGSLFALSLVLESTAAHGQLAPPRGTEPAKAVPVEIAQPVPPDGLTLEDAVLRFLADNLELQALRDEITMAQAHVEAAGQRPQAALFFKIGANGIERTIKEPWEPPFRRWIDMIQSRTIKRVMEAQYEDAVRIRTDNLYTAFVDVQAANLAVRHAKTTLRGLESLTRMADDLQERGQLSQADLASSKTQRAVAASSVVHADTTLRKATLVLANLLNLPDAGVDQFKVQGDLESPPRRLPAALRSEELVQLAIRERPDLRAYRFGLLRAELDWLRALLAPLSQITIRPWVLGPKAEGPDLGGKEAGWSLGAWITLPTSTRNRGTLKRAAINVAQTRTQIAALERGVALDVRKALLDYEESRATVDRFRDVIVPGARENRDIAFRLWREGQRSVSDYLADQKQYNETIARYPEAAVALRRSMLHLNTAVGKRIMP